MKILEIKITSKFNNFHISFHWTYQINLNTATQAHIKFIIETNLNVT